MAEVYGLQIKEELDIGLGCIGAMLSQESEKRDGAWITNSRGLFLIIDGDCERKFNYADVEVRTPRRSPRWNMIETDRKVAFHKCLQHLVNLCTSLQWWKEHWIALAFKLDEQPNTSIVGLPCVSEGWRIRAEQIIQAKVSGLFHTKRRAEEGANSVYISGHPDSKGLLWSEIGCCRGSGTSNHMHSVVNNDDD